MADKLVENYYITTLYPEKDKEKYGKLKRRK
jgi:hypothetical protein